MNSSLRLRVLPLLAVSLAAPMLLAQSPEDTQSTVTTQSTNNAPSTIKQLVFQGNLPYSQQDLQTVSGLKPGMTITSDDLAAAIAKLSATGDFGDVQVVYYAPGADLNLILKLTASDPENRYQVHFANFPWWSESELDNLIHQSVPLFDGTVPQTGNQEDAVTAALQKILLTKQVTAKITSEAEPPIAGEQKSQLIYRITSPQIRFSAIDLTGASTDLSPSLARQTSALVGHPYSESALDGLLTALRDQGYPNATLTNVHREVVASAPSKAPPAGKAPASAPIEVHVSAQLSTGELYHLSTITVASAPDIAQHPNPVNTGINQSLRNSVAIIANAYRSAGYMDVSVTSIPKLDPSTHQLSYTLSVSPGEAYKVGTLKVEGLSPDQRKEFDSAWKLTSGNPFDATYVQTFLSSHPELRSLAGLSTRLATDADGDTHLVAVTVEFRHRSPQAKSTHPVAPKPKASQPKPASPKHAPAKATRTKPAKHA